MHNNWSLKVPWNIVFDYYFAGDYSGALSHYQVGLQGSSDGMELYARAQAGTARCNIRTGDIAKGVGFQFFKGRFLFYFLRSGFEK